MQWNEMYMFKWRILVQGLGSDSLNNDSWKICSLLRVCMETCFIISSCNLPHNNCLDSCAYTGKLSVIDLYVFLFSCLFLINLFATISEKWIYCITKHGAIRVLRLVQCQTIRTGCLVISTYILLLKITCWVFFFMTCLRLLFFFGTLH